MELQAHNELMIDLYIRLTQIYQPFQCHDLPMATGGTHWGCHRTAIPTVVPASSNMINDPSLPVALVDPARLPSSPEPPAAPVTTSRASQNHCAPVQYCDAADDTEFIDINTIKEGSDDDDSVANGTPAQPSGPGVHLSPAMPGMQTAPNPTCTAPLAALAAMTTLNPGTDTTTTNPLEAGSSDPVTTVDVKHLFMKSKLEDMVCKVCQ